MDQPCKIVIADRNRHVRNLLQRELGGAGFRVILAGEDRELMQLLRDEPAVDLLILDPDLPSSISIGELIGLLHRRQPGLPIAVYTFLNDEVNYAGLAGVVACLEKGEDISLLKNMVAKLIDKQAPPGCK
jgi:DNA-binding NtrC family response regulator